MVGLVSFSYLFLAVHHYSYTTFRVSDLKNNEGLKIAGT